MASAEVLYKEQGEKANPILHGNGPPVALMRLCTAPVLKHFMSGTRTVLLESPSGDSGLQLWDEVGLKELLKMAFQDYIGM